MKKLNIAVWNCGLIAKPIVKFIDIIKDKNINLSVICSTSFERKTIREKVSQDVEDVISVSDVYDDFWKDYKKLDYEKVLNTAKKNEAKYDVRFIEIIKADRHMGRAFVKGGWYPRSLFSEELEYIHYVEIVNKSLVFFDDFFLKNKIDLIHLEVASLNAKVACVVARFYGIKIRIPHPSRVDKKFFFSQNEFIEYPNLEVDYKKFLEKLSKDFDINKMQSNESYQLAITEISNYLDYRSLFFTLKNILRQILVHLYKKIIGNKKYSPYFISDKLKAVWKYHRGIKEADKQSYPKLNEYLQKKFVFYPMQLEPESATMVMTPEFDSQLHLIHLISSNLPVDWTLIIKEHPLALGTRPLGFIEQINSYPNVKLVNPYESAKAWSLNSKAVAMINGSVGYEAAFAGIPIISFGQYNLISMLKYVFTVDSHKTVRDSISKINLEKIPNQKNRELEGLALENALKKNSFSLDAESFYNNDVSIDSKEMITFVNELISSI